MAFCLHARESVRDGVRRIGLELIDSILADLRAGMNPTRIHETRKRCKMLRALLRLARGGLDAKIRRASNIRWRDLGRDLGRARDAEARLDTFHEVVTRPNACRDLARRLESEAESARRANVDAAALKRLTARVNAGRRAWVRLPFNHHGWRIIEPGLRESYREAHEALRAIRDDSPDEAFHEWRKCVKTLWYHTRLLGKVRPKKLKPFAETLEQIAELLGEDHDLTLLHAHASEHDGHTLDMLDPLIAHRRRKLHRKAMALAEPLFDHRPRAFAQKIKGWWQVWRG